MKIENGMFTGTFDEFLEYFFDKYGDMLVKNFNEQIKQELENVELPSNVNLEESQKRTWKKICENIKKEQRNT